MPSWMMSSRSAPMRKYALALTLTKLRYLLMRNSAANSSPLFAQSTSCSSPISWYAGTGADLRATTTPLASARSAALCRATCGSLLVENLGSSRQRGQDRPLVPDDRWTPPLGAPLVAGAARYRYYTEAPRARQYSALRSRAPGTVPGHLVEEQGRGHGDVERLDAAVKGNADEPVAPVPHKPVQAPPLAAQHEHDRRDQRPTVVGLLGAGVGAHHLEPLVPEAEQGIGQAPHAGHGEVGRRPGGRAGDGGGEAHRAPPGDDHAVGTRGLGGPDDRPEVAGILHAVERDQDGILLLLAGAAQEVLELHERLDGSEGHHALVGDPLAQGVQTPRIDRLDGDVPGPGLSQDLPERPPDPRGAGEEDAHERPSRPQGLEHRPAPDERGLLAHGVQRSRHLNPVGVSSNDTPRSWSLARIRSPVAQSFFRRASRRPRPMKSMSLSAWASSSAPSGPAEAAARIVCRSSGAKRSGRSRLRASASCRRPETWAAVARASRRSPRIPASSLRVLRATSRAWEAEPGRGPLARAAASVARLRSVARSKRAARATGVLKSSSIAASNRPRASLAPARTSSPSRSPDGDCGLPSLAAASTSSAVSTAMRRRSAPRAAARRASSVRVVPLQRLLDRDHVAQVAGHLLLALRGAEEAVVDPVAHEGHAPRVPFRLGDLVLVVGEDDVLPAPVDVQLLAQVGDGHGRALDVPPRPPRAPRAVPRRLAGLGRLPQDEVHGVFLPWVHLDAGSRLHLLQRSTRQPAVPGKGGHPEEHVPVPLVGEPSLLQRPDDGDHPGDLPRGPRIVGRALDPEGVHFAEEPRDVLLGQRLDGGALGAGRLDDPVLDVGEVLHVHDPVPPVLQVPADDVEDQVGHGVPHVRRAVHVGAADVHPDLPLVEGDELLLAPAQRVIHPKSHGSPPLRGKARDAHHPQLRRQLPPGPWPPRPRVHLGHAAQVETPAVREDAQVGRPPLPPAPQHPHDAVKPGPPPEPRGPGPGAPGLHLHDHRLPQDTALDEDEQRPAPRPAPQPLSSCARGHSAPVPRRGRAARLATA